MKWTNYLTEAIGLNQRPKAWFLKKNLIFNKQNQIQVTKFYRFWFWINLFLIVFMMLNIFVPFFNVRLNLTLALVLRRYLTFTFQSNLIITIIFCLYYPLRNTKLFNNYAIITMACAWISLTFIGYNFFLGVRIDFVHWTRWENHYFRIVSLSSIWSHVIAPILTISFWIYAARFYKLENQKIIKISYHVLWQGLIYPICFLIYAFLISHFKIWVVYNGFTNLNTNLGFLIENNVQRIIYQDNNGVWEYSFINGLKQIENITDLSSLANNKNITFGKISNIVYYFSAIGSFAFFLLFYRFIFNGIIQQKNTDYFLPFWKGNKIFKSLNKFKKKKT